MNHADVVAMMEAAWDAGRKASAEAVMSALKTQTNVALAEMLREIRQALQSGKGFDIQKRASFVGLILREAADRLEGVTS